MATIQAKHGWQPDVQAAVNKAVPGDIVEIPAGQFDWSGQLFVPQGVWLKGDGTIWRKRDNLSEWEAMVVVDASATECPFRMSGITLHGRLQDLQGDNRSTVVTDIKDQGVLVRGKASVLIYNCVFTSFTRAGIEFDGSGTQYPGTPTGVIWANSFIDIWYSYLGYGVSIAGDPSIWDEDLRLGSLDQIYIEANHYDRCRHFVAGSNGACYVARDNLVLDHYQDAAAFDNHGLSASWPRGGPVGRDLSQHAPEFDQAEFGLGNPRRGRRHFRQ
jgi:hypothetical protein